MDEKVRLASLMSEVSESLYMASWHTGLEFVLWEAVAGRCALTGLEEETAELKRLSDSTGGWVIWDEGAGSEVWIPLDQWLAILSHGKKERG